MEKAKGLTKNPLGIIALFISLIYGFVCLVLSTSLKNLEGQAERLPLIWFVIVFPVLILICFIYLVVNHHGKLYAPSDYKDETNFIKTIDAKNQTQRIKNEVDAISKDIEENIVLENKEIIRNIQQVNKKDIQNKYLIAEDLALRAFEQDKKITIKRQGRILSSSNRALEFDGVAVDGKYIYGLDVKFTVHKHLSKILRDKITNDIVHYSRIVKDLKTEIEFKFVFIVVTESDNYLSLERELKSIIESTDINSELIVYNFDELKKRFGIE
jgi:hypothetical protein